jgi:phosphatidylglycerol---prolipoprotein diacylglyceryl transferase
VPGQSIVGGLLGGLVGVELAKRMTRQSRSTGDALVLPLVAGIAVGRIGCFLAGLHDDTYGVATTLPWGVDLGDGVMRHPSPLYEIAFLLALGGLLWRSRDALAPAPGLQFKLFLAAYLAWRLLGDTLKPVRFAHPFGLSGIQWVCLVALTLYLPLVWRAGRQLTPKAQTA